MKHTDLLEQGSSESQTLSILSDGESTSITFQMPRDLKEAAIEIAYLRGVSSSTFVHTCPINEPSRRQ